MKTIYIDDGDALNIDRVIVSMTDLKGCKVFYSCDLIDEYESKLKADMAAILDKIRAEIKELQPYFREMLILDEVMQILDKYKAESENP